MGPEMLSHMSANGQRSLNYAMIVDWIIGPRKLNPIPTHDVMEPAQRLLS